MPGLFFPLCDGKPMELLKLNRLILLEANGELESNGPIELMKLAYCETRRSQVDQQEVPKYVCYKAKRHGSVSY